MRYIKVEVQFKTSFTYEVEDDEWVDNEWVNEVTEEGLVDDTIETLADLSNQYWRDADFELTEVYADK